MCARETRISLAYHSVLRLVLWTDFSERCTGRSIMCWHAQQSLVINSEKNATIVRPWLICNRTDTATYKKIKSVADKNCDFTGNLTVNVNKALKSYRRSLSTVLL